MCRRVARPPWHPQEVAVARRCEGGVRGGVCVVLQFLPVRTDVDRFLPQLVTVDEVSQRCPCVGRCNCFTDCVLHCLQSICAVRLFFVNFRFGAERKKKLEADYEKESQRGVAQVLSASITGCVIAVAYFVVTSGGVDAPISFGSSVQQQSDGGDRDGDDDDGAAAAAAVQSWLLAAYLGHYACSAGDTWASELGILDPFGLPRLALAPWRQVPKVSE